MVACAATLWPEPRAEPRRGLPTDAPLRPGHHLLQPQPPANSTASLLHAHHHPSARPFPRLSPPSSRRRLFPPPGFFTRGPRPHSPPPRLPPPRLHPLHSVPTPAEFNPDDDHYDTRPAQGHNPHAFTRQVSVEGQDIARVPLINFLHEQWNSWWLRHLAHGGEVRIVVAKSMPESVFAAELLSQIRQRHFDLDALALHVATQEGATATKPAAVKLLTSKIFDYLISLRPTATTDPASATTILQLQQQLADARNQLAQQASSPSPSPTPTPYDASMPSVTYGGETSHTLPCTSFTASPHTYLNHTIRQASRPYDPIQTDARALFRTSHFSDLAFGPTPRLADRHPSLPKHEGHLLFSGSDSHELFDPDTVSILSGSMRNSFFPPRGILMNRLIQAFHHWAKTNNLPLLDPSTLSTIADFHFDLHLPHTHTAVLSTRSSPTCANNPGAPRPPLRRSRGLPTHALLPRGVRQDAGCHFLGSHHLCSVTSPLH